MVLRDADDAAAEPEPTQLRERLGEEFGVAGEHGGQRPGLGRVLILGAFILILILLFFFLPGPVPTAASPRFRGRRHFGGSATAGQGGGRC